MTMVVPSDISRNQVSAQGDGGSAAVTAETGHRTLRDLLLSRLPNLRKLRVLTGGKSTIAESRAADSSAAESAQRDFPPSHRPPAYPVRILNGPRDKIGFEITAGVQWHLDANPGDPHCRYQQIVIARGRRPGIFNTPEMADDVTVSRNQARITIARNGTVIIENGKEDLSTPNYVGRPRTDGTYDWREVGKNGALAEPGDSLLIAGKYLMKLPEIEAAVHPLSDHFDQQLAIAR